MGNVFETCSNQNENVMVNKKNEVVYKGRSRGRNEMIMRKHIINNNNHNNRNLFKEFNKGLRKHYSSNENSRIKASFEELNVDGFGDDDDGNRKIKRINLVMNLLRDDVDDYNGSGNRGQHEVGGRNDNDIGNKNRNIINVRKRKYNSHKRVTFADNLIHDDNNLINNISNNNSIKKSNSINSIQTNKLEIFSNTLEYNSIKTTKENKPQFQIQNAVSINLSNIKHTNTYNHHNTNTPYSTIETISSSKTLLKHTRNSPLIAQQSFSSGNIPLEHSNNEAHHHLKNINDVLYQKHQQYNTYKTKSKLFNTIPIPLPTSALSTHFSLTTHNSKTSSPLKQHQQQLNQNHSQTQSQPLPLSLTSPHDKHSITVSFPKSQTQIDKYIITNNTINNRLHLSYETLSQISPNIILYDGTLLKIQYTKNGYKILPKYFQITKNNFRYYNSTHINQTITPLLQFDIRNVCNIKISTNKMLKLKSDNKIVFAFVIYLDYSCNEFFEFGVDDLNIGVDFIKVLTLIMNYHEDINNNNN